ncbi:hypothetical protein EON67_05415 [archaeon]|nr:MAG: hypothetical protein EON67_05415 [archaeon]
MQSPKAVQLRKIVGEQFRANRHVTDPGTLLALKQKYVPVRDAVCAHTLRMGCGRVRALGADPARGVCVCVRVYTHTHLCAHGTRARAQANCHCRAAVGLSNYLLFERSKQDPKIAAVAAELDNFEDDEEGNLVRVPKAGKAPKSGAGKKGGKGAVSGMPPPLA